MATLGMMQRLSDVEGREVPDGMERRATGARPHIAAVEDERMDVKIQVEGAPKPLQHGHGAASPASKTVPRRSAPQRSKDRAHKDADDGTAEVVIPGQPVAQAQRQCEHPLADGHIRQHGIDEVGGAFHHAASSAARAETAPFTRECHQPFHAAAAAPETGEAAREPPTPQEVPKLVIDERRQTLAVTEPAGVCSERLPVFLNDPVQQTPARTTRFVGRRAAGHAAFTGRAVCLISGASIRPESWLERRSLSDSATPSARWNRRCCNAPRVVRRRFGVGAHRSRGVRRRSGCSCQ